MVDFIFIIQDKSSSIITRLDLIQGHLINGGSYKKRPLNVELQYRHTAQQTVLLVGRDGMSSLSCVCVSVFVCVREPTTEINRVPERAGGDPILLAQRVLLNYLL